MTLSHNQKFAVNVAGIFISYFFFGLLQEKVTRSKYTYETVDTFGSTVEVVERFSYALCLVFVLCFVNYLVAKLMQYKWPSTGEDTTPPLYYGSVALTYLLAMVCSNMALQWVPYPTQVVGKAAKPIPVMVLGVLIGRKTYTIQKYLFIGLIVTGVILFMYKEDAAMKPIDGSTVGLGEILLVLSLTMDGLTGAIQERIRAESKPSGLQMMLTSNAWSTIYLFVAMLLTGEAIQFGQFTSRHPQVLGNILILGLMQSIGQVFLYSMVSESGPLLVSVVTTTRKFFTVLASVVIFGNVLNTKQWLGAFTVFLGLFLDVFFSKSASKQHK